MVASKRAHTTDSAGPSNKKPKVEVLSDDDVLYASTDRDEDSADDESYGSSEEEDAPNGRKKASGLKNRKGKEKQNQNGRVNGNRKAKGRAKGEDVKVASKAEILSLATDAPPGGRGRSAKDKLSDIDDAVIQRIKKALSLGMHEGTGEAEAKLAMRLASKLMAQHNVDQADILASEDDAQKLKRAGQSTVTIRSLSGSRVLLHAWSRVLASAMDEFFDCKSYSTTFGNRVDWTFYGLAEQTVAAAYAYEMVYNLILTWSAQKKTAKGRTQKNNYCYGVADGLYDLAVRGRKEEERLAIKKAEERLRLAAKAEEEERERELARLKGPDADEETKVKVELVIEEEDEKKVKVEDAGNRAVHDGPDDDPPFDGSDYGEPGGDWGDGYEHGDDFRADFDAEDEDIDEMLRDLDTTGHIKVKRDPSPVPVPKPEEVKPVKIEEEDTPWQSGQQLTLFRSNAMSIADEYLKKSKIKVYAGPRISGPNFKKGGYAIYKQGKEDAKKIDVKRKRIKDVEQD